MLSGLGVLGAALALGALLLVVGLVVRAVLRLRGPHLVTCPETRRPAAVELDLEYSVVSAALGRPSFRLQDCTRWPEKRHCGQACLGELEAAPQDCLARNVLARWYQRKRCAYCGRRFGEIHWHDRKPALRTPDGRLLEWSEVPPVAIPDVLATHWPVCWSCLIVETLRRDHRDLITERPARPLPREGPAPAARPHA